MTEHRDAIIDAVCRLIEQGGWRNVTINGIARVSGLSLLDLYKSFERPIEVFRWLGAKADEAMLAETADLQGEPPKEQLLELLLRRFETLLPYRAAFKRLADDRTLDPMLIGLGVENVTRASGWALAVTERPERGLRGCWQRGNVALAYGRAARVWLTDDSESLAQTMAALDKHLASVAVGARTARQSGLQDSGGDPAPDAA